MPLFKMTVLTLMTSLFLGFSLVDVSAGSRREITGFDTPDQAGHERTYDRTDQHDKTQRERLGERMAWRDYQMHMQKHYRIMEKYGGGSYVPVYRMDHKPRGRHDHDYRQHRSTERSRNRR